VDIGLVMRRRLVWLMLLVCVASCAVRNFDHSKSAELQAGSSLSGLSDRVVDPNVLTTLESWGFNLGSMMPSAADQRKFSVNNAELWRHNTAYKDVVNEILGTIAKRKAADPSLSVTGSHRTLDEGFLKSPEATFELIAVFNRADISLQLPKLCTVVRFLYRLAYAHKNDAKGRIDASRLPMTLAVNHSVPMTTKEACADYLQRWKSNLSTEALVAANGPLAGSVIGPKSFSGVESMFRFKLGPHQSLPRWGPLVSTCFDSLSSTHPQGASRSARFSTPPMPNASSQVPMRKPSSSLSFSTMLRRSLKEQS
jgi:hypothetical protein